MFKSVNKLVREPRIKILPVRLYTSQRAGDTVKNTSRAINENVPGLSDKCVAVPSQPIAVNTAKDKEYKNPEYFCYHVDSFAEAEVELAPFRLPVPSNKRKN